MRRALAALVFGACLASPGLAVAAEKTVTLAVPGMYCEACPYIVKQTLAKVGGVGQVTTSLATKTATVTFHDQKTNLAALTTATANAGYPSHLAEKGATAAAK